MALFFFGNNFGKNKETFKIFSPQILDVYRILLVLTTLESIMIYYTFSVINTMFVPCTELLYDSTAATRTIKLFTTLLSISCAICLISFLMMSFLVCGNLCQRYSSVLFKVVVWNEVVPHFSNRTLEYLRHNFPWDRLISRQTDNLGHPIPKISTAWLFSERVTERQSLWKQSTDKRGHHQKRNQTDSTRNAQ